MVTVAFAVSIFPLVSVTVNVTVFAPKSAQVNEFGDTDNDATAQSSEDPLFTSLAVIVAFPELSN